MEANDIRVDVMREMLLRLSRLITNKFLQAKIIKEQYLLFVTRNMYRSRGTCYFPRGDGPVR